MTGFVKFRYSTLHWRRPELTTQQEINFGREVCQRGRREMNRVFRTRLFHSEKTKDTLEYPKTIGDKVFIAVCLIAGVAGCVMMPMILPIALLCGVFAGGMYLGSGAIAMLRYDHWLRTCGKKYFKSLKANPIQKVIIECGCGQRLRIPCITKRLKIKCPACFSQFEY